MALSSHGYGHAAQTAEVVNALRAQRPSLKLTLATQLPCAFLARRFDGPFTFIERETDIGMVMHSALRVDRAASWRAYCAFHAQWDEQVDAEARWLEHIAPDLVLANVPYRILTAAKRVGIPAVALCSLNWADIFFAYFGVQAQAAWMHAQMQQAYQDARVFLRCTPGMPMPDLGNVQPIGCCARLGQARRSEIHAALGIDAAARLILIAPGGQSLRLPVECWRLDRAWQFLVPASWGLNAAPFHALEALPFAFTDVLCSVDAVIGKPGYGTFAEAACNGVPMLYVRRDDGWPEEPYLIDWFEQRARTIEMERAALARGALAAPLAALWQRPPRDPPRADGVAQATTHILSLLAPRVAHAR